MFAELLLLAWEAWLALTTWLASAALPRLARAWSGATLLERLRTAGPLFAELLLLAGQTLLARSRLSWSALRSGAAALATLLELLCATGTLFAKLLLLAALLALTTLLAWCAGLAPWTLLRLPLTALLPTGLAFVLLLALVLVLGVFALRDDQAAVYSAGAVKRDAQLRNRNRRHQGAGEQDVAKLLQLPDRFEWQVALPGES